MSTDYLLPSGLRDVLPPDAGRQYAMLHTILERFFLFGYQLVMPPLLEFEETMLAGKAKSLETQTFRFMDPVSRRMLALRADITVQVTRIAASRLVREPLPLRLCYSGNVMRTQAERMSNERQLPQAGIELIGSSDAMADVEVITALVEALQVAGIGGIVVDLSLSGLITLIAETPLAVPHAEALQDAITHKNCDNLPLDLPARELFIHLIELSGPAHTVLPRLKKLALHESVVPMVAALETVVTALSALKNITLTLDPLEASRFSYHEGLCFSLFLASNHQEVGRGGRYVIDRADGSSVPATGGTLYLNRLLDGFAAGIEKKPVTLPPGTAYTESRAERDRGIVTLHGLKE